MGAASNACTKHAKFWCNIRGNQCRPNRNRNLVCTKKKEKFWVQFFSRTLCHITKPFSLDVMIRLLFGTRFNFPIILTIFIVLVYNIVVVFISVLFCSVYENEWMKYPVAIRLDVRGCICMCVCVFECMRMYSKSACPFVCRQYMYINKKRPEQFVLSICIFYTRCINI